MSPIVGKQSDGTEFVDTVGCELSSHSRRCTVFNPSVGLPFPNNRVTPEALEFDFERASAVLMQYGISTLENTSPNSRHYGAWMRHSGFAISHIRNYGTNIYYGIAGGDHSTPPPTSFRGTYEGMMVGTPTDGNLQGDFLQGKALLEYRWSADHFDAAPGGLLEAEFSSIYNLTKGQNYPTVSPVRFDPILVQINGTFYGCAAGLSGCAGDSRISGAFYGGASEVAGTLQWDGPKGFVGAFGAKRQ